MRSAIQVLFIPTLQIMKQTWRQSYSHRANDWQSHIRIAGLSDDDNNNNSSNIIIIITIIR